MELNMVCPVLYFDTYYLVISWNLERSVYW